MDFIGTKIKGELVHPPAIREQKRKYWERVPEGAVVMSSITMKRRSKSQEQLGAIWGLMMAQAKIELDDRGYDTSFLLNTPNPTGIPIDERLLCDYFYNVCPIFNEEGQRITLSKSNTKEAAKFFDDVRNFLASQWSIVVAEPDPNWRNKSE